MELGGIWWKAVSYGLPLLEIVLMGYCLYRLTAPFMERKRGALQAGAAYVLAMWGIYIVSLCMGEFPLCRMMGALAVFFVMCRADRRNYGQKAFLVQTFFSLHQFAGAAAEMVYDNMYYIIGNTDYIAAHPNLSFVLYVGVCVIYPAAELLFMSVSIWCILKTYVYRYAGMSKKELFVLMTPSFMGVTGYWVIWHYRNFYITEIQRNSDIYDMLSMFYYIVAMITIVAVIALYQSIKAGQEEKLQNELLAVQMEDIRRHMEQVENLYQDIRGVRHDMANHIATLEGLYEADKTEEAKAYGTRLKNALSQTAGQLKSGNPVTDVILLGAKREAEKNGIEFRSEFYYPAGLSADAFDISVALNNALGNALENVTESGKENVKPYIFVRSYRRNNAYMIEVCNSFTGIVQWDAQSGLPMTSKGKKDGQAHGYGLSNIRRVAEKYSGDIAVDIQDGEFRLSIMLMMEQEEEQST